MRLVLKMMEMARLAIKLMTLVAEDAQNVWDTLMLVAI
jgi:hypothetical protein